jgi:hypothetical protein
VDSILGITGGDFTPMPVPTKYDPLAATSTSQAAQPVSATQTPIPNTQPAPPTREPLPTGQLIGAVLGLMPSNDGLWAMRPDGAQMTLLTNEPIDHLAVSPGGSMAAYITHANPNSTVYDQPFGYQLKIITLYDDKIYPVTPLEPAGLNAQSPQPSLDGSFQTLIAYSTGGMAWSPDGHALAFVSSHEGDPNGPLAGDVYLYTPSAGKISKVSNLSLPSGAAHAYNLDWSRDGQFLYYDGAYGFGENNTASVAGAWVSGLNGNITQVAPGEQSAGERLESWLPGSNVLLASNNGGCTQNIRAVNIRTAKVQVIWPGCYADMLYDRLRNELLISVTSDLSGDGNPAGLFLVSLYNNPPAPRKISDEGFQKLYRGDYRTDWYGYRPDKGLFSISRRGAATALFSGGAYGGEDGGQTRPLLHLPDFTTWLWSGPTGLFVAKPGSDPQQILPYEPQNLIQSPTQTGLYFFIGPRSDNQVTSLYAMRARDWKPYLVDERIQNPDSLIWVP